MLDSKYSTFEQPVQEFPDFMPEEFPETVPYSEKRLSFLDSKHETSKRTSDTLHFNFNRQERPFHSNREGREFKEKKKSHFEADVLSVKLDIITSKLKYLIDETKETFEKLH